MKGINYPAPRGGVFEERKLPVSVWFDILTALVLNVLSDHVLVPMLVHCSSEISVC